MTWSLEDGPVLDPLSPVDPYLWWALGPGLPDFAPEGIEDPRVPLMTRPRADVSPARRDAAFARLPEASRRALGPFAASAQASREPGEAFSVAFLALPRLHELFIDLSPRDPARTFIAQELGLVILGPPLPRRLLARDTAPDGATSPPSPPKPPAVVVGIIDDGLAFAHKRFQTTMGGTRFSAVWLQDGDPIAPSPVEYGREITGAQIDAWLAAIDEEGAIYAAAGASDFAGGGHKPVEQRVSHGTHVLDRAFGFDPAEAPDWAIIGVQLPVRTVADSSGARLSPYAVDAVKYIERVARERHPGVPVAVVFSYGFTAGPHDGKHPIERGIHDVISLRNKAGAGKMRIVIPSGNSHLGRLHARIAFEKAPPQPARTDLLWRVQPEDRTPSFVEIWLPGAYNPAGRLALGLVTPDGEDSGDVLVEGSHKVLTLTDAGGRVVCWALFHADPASNRGMFLVAMQPTTRRDGSAPSAPAGLWTIGLVDRGLGDGAVVEAWIQRDEAPFGYPPLGRQSYFDHADYLRFEATGEEREEDDAGTLIQRGGSLNALATGPHPIVVGGLLRKTMEPAPYSAGGPNLTITRLAPSALVTSDDSRVHAGVIAAGTRSGSWAVLNGTSVAGARAARWVAERLAAGLGSDSAALEAEARTNDPNNPVPPQRGGMGRLAFPPNSSRPRDRRFDPS